MESHTAYRYIMEAEYALKKRIHLNLFEDQGLLIKIEEYIQSARAMKTLAGIPDH